MKFIQMVLLYCCISTISCHVVKWNYGNKGPATWKNHFSICARNRQSPINIEPKTTTFQQFLRPFHFDYFDKNQKNVLLRNNGHTVEIDLRGNFVLPIGEGSLWQSYKSLQFHFHWAKKDQNGGSEHTVNGKHSWGELHVVLYNTKYDKPTVAMHQKHGLAVLAFLIEADAPKDHQGFSAIAEWIKGGPRYKDQSGHLITFNFADVVKGANLWDYYRYKGSLTTPTCDETVTWTVFKQPIHISAKQATLFQQNLFSSKEGETKQMEAGNFRPTQPLNTREVLRSFPFTS